MQIAKRFSSQWRFQFGVLLIKTFHWVHFGLLGETESPEAIFAKDGEAISTTNSKKK